MPRLTAWYLIRLVGKTLHQDWRTLQNLAECIAAVVARSVMESQPFRRLQLSLVHRDSRDGPIVSNLKILQPDRRRNKKRPGNSKSADGSGTGTTLTEKTP